MTLDYKSTVTLNKKHCHPQCYLMQLNGYMRDTKDPGQLWKQFKGGPANPLNGECGKEKKWGFCTVSKKAGDPAAPTNIPKAAAGFDWQGAINTSVDEAIVIAMSQDFRDGNHRTALENMFDTLNYQGLSIRFDTAGNPEVDGFRLYVQLKSVTDQTGKWPQGDRARAKTEMVKLLKDVVRIRDVTWAERLGLTQFVKVDTPKVLKEVDDFHKKLLDMEKKQGKRAAEEYYKGVKKTDPLLYFRHLYLWGNI